MTAVGPIAPKSRKHLPTYRRVWWYGGPYLRRPFWRPGPIERWEWTCSCGKASARGAFKREVKRAAEFHAEHVN